MLLLLCVQVPLVIPLLIFLVACGLVLVPLITSPRMEYIYALVLIVVGYIFYIPLVYFKLTFPFMSKISSYVIYFNHIYITE